MRAAPPLASQFHSALSRFAVVTSLLNDRLIRPRGTQPHGLAPVIVAIGSVVCLIRGKLFFSREDFCLQLQKASHISSQLKFKCLAIDLGKQSNDYCCRLRLAMNQATRLLLFFVIFLTPLSGLAYVSSHGLQKGNEESLFRVLLILSFSLAVTLICAIAQPIKLPIIVNLTRAGLANLGFAVIDVLIFALLLYFSSEDACQLANSCAKYPVVWLALAGMHLCYAAWAYVTKLRSATGD